jgi:LPXTG-motif cell wall-anchored protein
MSFTVSLDVPARPAPLPRTGANVEVLVAVALVLLLVGAMIVRSAR